MLGVRTDILPYLLRALLVPAFCFVFGAFCFVEGVRLPDGVFLGFGAVLLAASLALTVWVFSLPALHTGLGQPPLPRERGPIAGPSVAVAWAAVPVSVCSAIFLWATTPRSSLWQHLIPLIPAAVSIAVAVRIRRIRASQQS